MKFGCCTNMVAQGEDVIGINRIEKLYEYGYDYVELPLAQIMEISDEDFALLKKRISDSKINCETCNNFFPTDLKLTGPQIDEESIENYYKKALKRASELGVKYVVFGSGPAKNIPEGFPVKEGYGQVVNMLKKIAIEANKRDIVIAIEPLRKQECNLINTFNEGCKLAEDVGSRNVKVLVDYYHLSVEKEPVKNIVDLGEENLVHVHFAKAQGRTYPESLEEDSEYTAFIQALKDIGYKGRVSCEAYSDDFDRDAQQTIKFFKGNFL